MPLATQSLTDILAIAQQHAAKGAFADALTILNAARLKESHPAYYIEISNIFAALNNMAACAEVLQQGLSKHPDTLALIVAYANHCYQNNHVHKGLNVTTPLVDKHDCPISVLVTHGHLLKLHGDIHEAEKVYHRALDHAPNNMIALSSLGHLALDTRDYETAIAYFEQALAKEKQNTHTATQLAYAYFRHGNLQKGWEQYGMRFGVGGNVQARPHNHPPWNGKPLSQGKLLLWGEQAIGEEVLYASMIGDAVKAANTTCIVECDTRLESLFKRSFPNITCIARGAAPLDLAHERIAAQCAAGNLGGFFRNRFSDFPKRQAYLTADPIERHKLRERYEAWKHNHKKDGKIIGVSWKSKPLRHGDPKSTALEDWAIVFENSPHLFIALQYGDCTDDFALAQNRNWCFHDDSDVDQHTSLDTFASQVCAMDAVISVSNTTAHMAGACGIKTAVLLPKSKGLMWHWFDKHTDTYSNTSAWYPSTQLLRQDEDGKWQHALLRARHWLDAL